MTRYLASRGRWVALVLSLVVVVLGVLACGGNGSTETTTPPATGPAIPGSITATVSSIQDQNGNTLSVDVFDSDWSPGAPNTYVGRILVPITSDDFSSSVVVTGVGADGSPTNEPATFQPGTYSVVFFVSAPGSPPQFFSEVRATVAGDITVSAPAWGSW